MSGNITYKESSHTDNEKKASLNLARESFGDTDIAYEKYYDWQFLQNPVGKGTVVFAYDGDVPVGQAASIPCRYMISDEGPVTITLTMNVCVSEKHRGRGILTELMDQIHKTGRYPVPFSVGIPNDQSMRGHLKNNYQPLPMALLVRPVILSNYFTNSAIRRIFKPFDRIWKKGTYVESQQYSKRFDERFNDLNLASHHNFIRQIRDSRFLNWRYLDNPRRKYKIFAALEQEQVQGYLVVRVTEVFGTKLGLIVDFVARDETQSTRDLVLNALKYFWENKVTFAAVACFPSCIEYQLLKRSGFYVVPGRFRPHPLAVCIKILDDSRYEQELLLNSDNWFFMFGDYETF